MTETDRRRFHEVFERGGPPKRSSDRAFGIVFAVVFAIVGLWPLLEQGSVRWWSLGLALLFLAVAQVRPALLGPLNVVWTGFGLLLNRVVSPLVLGFLFYLTVTPIGLLMRMTGKDPLRLEFDPQAKSYWIERRPPGPAPETMTRQF